MNFLLLLVWFLLFASVVDKSTETECEFSHICIAWETNLTDQPLDVPAHVCDVYFYCVGFSNNFPVSSVSFHTCANHLGIKWKIDRTKSKQKYGQCCYQTPPKQILNTFILERILESLIHTKWEKFLRTMKRREEKNEKKKFYGIVGSCHQLTRFWVLCDEFMFVLKKILTSRVKWTKKRWNSREKWTKLTFLSLTFANAYT